MLTAAVIVLGGLAVMAVPREAPPGAAIAATAFAGRVAPHSHGDVIDARFRQGVVMLHAHKYEYAMAAFHEVLKYAPEMPEAHVNMGYALIGLGRYAEAQAFFETATNLRPGQLNAYYGLAEALEGLHDLPGALGAMRAYRHLAAEDDPFRKRAEAAIWEWESSLGTPSAADLHRP